MSHSQASQGHYIMNEGRFLHLKGEETKWVGLSGWCFVMINSTHLRDFLRLKLTLDILESVG